MSVITFQEIIPSTRIRKTKAKVGVRVGFSNGIKYLNYKISILKRTHAFFIPIFMFV